MCETGNQATSELEPRLPLPGREQARPGEDRRRPRPAPAAAGTAGRLARQAGARTGRPLPRAAGCLRGCGRALPAVRPPPRARELVPGNGGGGEPRARRPGRGARPRTENYQRRRRRARAAKQKRAAKLLARKLKRVEVATALGVTTRTLRNWSAAPDFIRRLERERERLERAEADGARPRVSSRGRGGQPLRRPRGACRRSPSAGDSFAAAS